MESAQDSEASSCERGDESSGSRDTHLVTESASVNFMEILFTGNIGKNDNLRKHTIVRIMECHL
jgi:hypothetical protein